MELLYHENYYDGVLSGVGLYQGRKVFFNLKDDYRKPKLDDPSLPANVKTYINELKNDDYTNHDDDEGIDLDFYCVYNFGYGIEVEQKRCFDVYDVSKKKMNASMQKMIDFSLNKGWHCWHHPNYLDYVKEFEDEIKNEEDNKENEDIYLFTVAYDKIKYYFRNN